MTTKHFTRDDAEKWGRHVATTARALHRTEGHVKPILFLMVQTDPTTGEPFEDDKFRSVAVVPEGGFRGPDDKAAFMDKAREIAKDTGAVASALVAEAWVSDDAKVADEAMDKKGTLKGSAGVGEGIIVLVEHVSTSEALMFTSKICDGVAGEVEMDSNGLAGLARGIIEPAN